MSCGVQHGRIEKLVDGRGIGPLTCSTPDASSGTKRRPPSRRGRHSRACRSIKTTPNPRTISTYYRKILTYKELLTFGGPRGNVNTNRVTALRCIVPPSGEMAHRPGFEPGPSRLRNGRPLPMGRCVVQEPLGLSAKTIPPAVSSLLASYLPLHPGFRRHNLSDTSKECRDAIGRPCRHFIHLYVHIDLESDGGLRRRGMSLSEVCYTEG